MEFGIAFLHFFVGAGEQCDDVTIEKCVMADGISFEPSMSIQEPSGRKGKKPPTQ
jgi:hypothetical protein